jgi:hypothetical protein
MGTVGEYRVQLRDIHDRIGGVRATVAGCMVELAECQEALMALESSLLDGVATHIAQAHVATTQTVMHITEGQVGIRDYAGYL